MSDLAIDPLTGDLAIAGHRLSLVTGAPAVRQAWASRLTLFRGEAYLAPELGIDYPGTVLVKRPNTTVVRAIFAQATRETPGVADVTTLQVALEPRSRTLSIVAEVTTRAGDAETLELSEALGA